MSFFSVTWTYDCIRLTFKQKRIWYLSLSQVLKYFIALLTDFYQAFLEYALYYHFQGNIIPTGLGSD